jgi:glycosyltransferase involved in cell wall biosynthesis
MSDTPLVSIVIPARNEVRDIAATLDTILAIDYEPKEILVVDDSTDETPDIVVRYAGRGVRLIHREQNRNGCCGARNLGMRSTTGEIIVLMNADDRPRPDFLQRLLPHYQNGADYMIVKSAVLNRDVLWGRFTAAAEQAARGTDPEWSEGFSCRRTAAVEVGYIPGDFPVPFCRDYMLGVALNRAGFKKRVDLTIPMGHIVPETLSAYWSNQVWRGTFSAPHAYYLRQMPLALIWLRELLKATRTVLRYLFVLPAIWRAARLTKFAPAGWRDFPGLFLVGVVQDLALIVGNFKGLLRTMQAHRSSNRCGASGECGSGKSASGALR